MSNRLMFMLCVTALGLLAVPVVGQDVPAAAEDRQPLSATAVLVQGRVFLAPVGVAATDTESWRA